MREDWEECTFGEIAIIYNGDSINAQIKKDKYQKITNGFNYIGTKDIDYDGTINYINGVKIPANENKFKIAPKGCVLVCSEGGSAGRKTAYVDEDICFGNKLYAITNQYSVFEGKYIYYYTRFRGFFEDFKNQMNGIIGGVSANKFSEIPFPLSPLPIQRAIVSKIEALFSDLDNGIANFKKAQEQLKIYRQAVLKKAFEGYSKLSTVGDEFDFVGGGTPSKANSDYWNGDLYWCSVKDVKGDNLHKTIDKITRKGLKESASNLAQPEEVILITRISPGKTIISKVETAINQDLKVIKPKREYLSKLIHYLFQAYQREIIKLSSGTTVLGINLTNLKSIEIPFLSSQEQTQIVQEIESRLSVCDKVEQSISESIIKAEALRQSILKKAFEGKLLSKAEIEQCKKEADYEPASELLKKIQAEKAERITNDKLRITKKRAKK